MGGVAGLQERHQIGDIGKALHVDLNPIRAALAQTPETSDHTSAQRRIQARQAAAAALSSPTAASGEAPVVAPSATAPDACLAPVALQEAATAPGPLPSLSPARCSDKGFLPMSLHEYLELLDWTGRQMAAGKRGAMPAELEPILVRLGIPADDCLDLTQNFGRLFQRVAGGCPALERERQSAATCPGTLSSADCRCRFPALCPSAQAADDAVLRLVTMVPAVTNERPPDTAFA
jgi:hypothetical protein